MTLRKIFFILAALLTSGIVGCKKDGAVSAPVDQGVTYEISSALFPNPERGFMKTLIVFSDGAPLSLAQMNLLRGQNISLVLRVFYLDNFKNTAISASELQLIQNDLNTIRDAGLKAILRFAYTDDMSGTDAPLAIVQQHLDQLKPVFENNKDIIAFVQAGFIGAYGEWHSSSNGLATIENEKTVLNKLLSVLPPEIMVQVRTPLQKQQIFTNNSPVTADIAYSTEARARVGHHNDCFLSGGTEYGTYSNITLEKQYISNEANFVPVGGETCPPTGGYSPTCVESQNQMKLLKWTYLNLDYYPATINGWRTSGCFDEFQRSLGHRLAMVKSDIADAAALNSALAVKIELINRGYAPLYHKKNVSLVLKNKTSGAFYNVPMATDLRTIKPSLSVVVNESLSLSGIPAGEYDLYLKIADRADALKNRIEYSVRLANTGTWVEENGGINNLKQTVKIN
ncbi:DUF4832 domain-containing protein [Ferruginibacter sp. HRS2-29]|uniref:DUF4832 domain-containing protein n=1 Tax=Ferruginibacter sp. HRS2-29 TaxID=2487334 RepID=UPI0020CD242A|nr:DUF4832 domain-containing protein [Ferruginibacter sp. HRS2-29]MCP9750200.1 DUF4832 domain-containing protein [Ferruginibacter sp. HRS2-29]